MLGWSGKDGSNSFSDYSCEQLGGPEVTGVHRAELTLDLYAHGVLLDRHDLELTAVSPRQSVSGFTVIDTLGNDDG